MIDETGRRPQIIAGWLVLLLVVLLFTFIAESVRSAQRLPSLLSHLDTVVARFQLPSVQHLVAKAALSLATALSSLLLMIFMLNYSRWFPRLMLAWFCAAPFFNLVVFGYFYYLTHRPDYRGPRLGFGSFVLLPLTTAAAILWVGYLRNSPRVRDTFVSSWPRRERSVA